MKSGSNSLDDWMSSLGVIREREHFATPSEELGISRFIRVCQSVKFLVVPKTNLFFLWIPITVSMLKTQVLAEKWVEKGRTFLLQRNGLLIAKAVQKYGHKCKNWDDLAQAGSVGFNHGLDLFNPEKNYRLSTFVYWWIRQGVQKEVYRQSRTIRLPMHLYESKKKIDRAILDFQKSEKSRRIPSVKVLSKMTGIEVVAIELALENFRAIGSLDRTATTADSCTLLDILPSPSYSKFNSPDFAELKNRVHHEISTLPSETEIQIIRLKNGLEGPGLTLPSVAKVMGLDLDYVKETYSKSIRALRHHRHRDFRNYAKFYLDTSISK